MILQAAKIIGSGLATIGLAGAGVGILRLNNYNRKGRNTYQKGNILIFKYFLIFCRQSNANGLFGVVESNEVSLQGSMNNQEESIAISKWCSGDIVTIECIAKAKYHFKKGSTPRYELLVILASPLLQGQGDVFIILSTCPNEKVINLYLNYMIDSQDLSLTDTYFTTVHNLQKIVYPIIIKSGNLGQVIINTLGIDNTIEEYLIQDSNKGKGKIVYQKSYILFKTFIKQVNKRVS